MCAEKDASALGCEKDDCAGVVEEVEDVDDVEDVADASEGVYALREKDGGREEDDDNDEDVDDGEMFVKTGVTLADDDDVACDDVA